jgi:uncharacterized protein DUF4349
MKLEDDLRQRLSLEAERLEPEPPSPKRLARRGRRRSRLKRTGIALSVVALLGTAGIMGRIALDDEQPTTFAGTPRISERGHRPPPATRPAPGPFDKFGERFRDQPSFAEPGDALGTENQQADVAGGPPRQSVDIGVGPKVIKTASLRLEVEDGAFQDAFDRAEDLAARYDGFITRSRTSGRDARSGELTLRVPAPDFEAALGDLKRIGVLRSEQVTGEEVTSEFVDLKARLRHRLAEERVVLRLLDQADTISETLTVRRVLDEVQLTIERLKGQLRLLRDQTSLATVTVRIHEQGAAPAEAAAESEIAGAWDRALEGAEDVVVAVIVGLGYVLPILVLLLLAWLALRAIRARVAT